MKKILILGIGSLCLMATNASVISSNQTQQAPQDAVIATAPTMLDLIKFYENQRTLAEIIKTDDIERLQKAYANDLNLNAVLTASYDSYLFADVKIPLIYYAAMSGSIKCFKYLLINGADPRTQVNFRLNFGLDCIAFAMLSDNTEIVRLLEQRQLNVFNNPGAWWAAALNNQKMFFDWLSRNSPIPDGSEY